MGRGSLLDIAYNIALLLLGATLFGRRDLLAQPRLALRFGVIFVVGALLALPIAYGAIVFSTTDAMFTGMRLAAYVVFVHVPIWCVVASVRLARRSSRWAAGLGAVAVVVVGVGIDAFLVEPYALEVRTVRIETPEVTRPIRIALVADLQTDGPSDYDREALLRVKAAEPDLVVFAGDYAHHDTREAYLGVAARLHDLFVDLDLDPPLGAFAVQGNVDPIGEWPLLFDGTAIRPVVETTRYDVDPELSVTALSFADSFRPSLEVARVDRFHVVVGHGPDYALGDVRADLLLAGHTHGGQVRLPGLGPIVTLSRVPRDWAAGVTRIDDDRTLIVSRGVGLERGPAPRLRFLCRPELVFVDLVPEGVIDDPAN